MSERRGVLVGSAGLGVVGPEPTPKYLPTKEVLLRLFEIHMIEWIGVEEDDALPFLFTEPVICGSCSGQRRWFILRDGETRCVLCDPARGLPA